MSTIEIPATGTLALGDAMRISLSFVALYVLYLVGSSIYNAYFTPLAKFPGPTINALTILPRTIALYQGREHSYVQKLHAKYGPVVRLGPKELSYAGGAQAWKDIHGFNKKNVAGNKDRIFYVKPINGIDGVITAGDDHGRQRKVLAHAFSDKALKEQEPLLKKWTSLLKDKLDAFAASGREADMLKLYNCTTFDIMGDLTFSEDLGMLQGGELSAWVKTIFQGIRSNSKLRAFRSFSVGRWFFDTRLGRNETIHRKRTEHWNYTAKRLERRLTREPDHPDLWTKVLEKDGDEQGLTAGEHHSNAAVFMLAGTETTATLLSGVTYHLLQNPQYLHKLTDEIRSTFSDFDQVTLEALARMKYMHAVLQEGLRMYPPVPIGLPRRTPAEGATLCDQYVPGDVRVSVGQYATYRMESSFKEPFHFRPERWLGDAEYKDDQLGAVEPFSVGPRNCLGKNLAWNEMRIILVAVLLHFDLQLCDPSDDWADQRVFTLWEKKPLMCKLSPAKA